MTAGTEEEKGRRKIGWENDSLRQERLRNLVLLHRRKSYKKLRLLPTRFLFLNLTNLNTAMPSNFYF